MGRDGRRPGGRRRKGGASARRDVGGRSKCEEDECTRREQVRGGRMYEEGASARRRRPSGREVACRKREMGRTDGER